MSSEYFTKTSLYLVRLKMLENLLKDINIKFRKTELVEILQLLRVWIHSSLSMQECRDESEIYNYQHIQVSNNKFIDGILGGVRLIWLDCIALFQFLHKNHTLGTLDFPGSEHEPP